MKRILKHETHKLLFSSALDSFHSCCSVKFFFDALKVCALIGIAWALSITLTFYQKWFIKQFHFPLTIVTCHLVIKFLLAAFCREVLEAIAGTPRVSVDWKNNIKRVAPTGIASSLDIGLSNWSFEFITVTLYTMTKSTTVVFVLIFAIMLKLEKLRLALGVVVGFIAGGLFLFTYHADAFNFQGFILVLSASALGGLRWALAQLVTQKDNLGLGNPVDMVYHVQPWMILSILPLAITFEAVSVATSAALFRYQHINVFMRTGLLTLIGGIIAFFMEVAEYLLLVKTSSLTVCIAGIVKELITILLDHFINGVLLSAINIIGLILCMSGITLHVVLKASNKAPIERDEEECRRMLQSMDESDEDDNTSVLFDRSRHIRP